MKNLLNKLSLERVENLPIKLGYGVELNSKFQLKDSWHRKKWHNSAKDHAYTITRAIQADGVGKNWNDVYSKLVKYVKTLSFDFTIDDAVNVHFCYWDTRRKEWWVLSTSPYKEPMMSLKDFIRMGSKYRYWRSKELYVCPETNILKSIKIKKTQSLTKKQLRTKYEKRTEHRRKCKLMYKANRAAGLLELKFINNPSLHKFYIDLLKKKKDLLVAINTKPEKKPELRKFLPYSKTPIENPQLDLKKRLTWWNYTNGQILIKAAKAKEELIPIQEQIDRLEKGELTGYFSSNVYLYSLQKECHHFAIP